MAKKAAKKVSVKEIQQLREKTNAPVMDCKQALETSKGDFDKAVIFLRKKGIATQAKRAHRQTKEGRVEAYVHLNNKIGVLLEVNCETDFVSRCDDFKNFTKDLAMQIAAMNPAYLKKEDVPDKVIREHKEQIADFYKTHCLLEQAFIKDQTKIVQDYLSEVVAKIGENIVIRRFVRYQLGE